MAEEEIPEVELNVKVEPVGGTKPRMVSFSVFECEGTPVYKPPPDLDGFFEQDFNKSKYEVSERDGLQPGDRILVPMLFAGHVWATVEQDEDGKLSARSGDAYGHFLKYSDKQPDGPRWVVTGSYNLRGLERLELYRGGPGAEEEGHHPDTTPLGRALLNQAADEHLKELLEDPDE